MRSWWSALTLCSVLATVDVSSVVGSGTLNTIHECRLCASGADPLNMYLQAEFKVPKSNSCSSVRSIGLTNVLVDNHADVAGGAVYATDMASLDFTCSNKLAWNDTTGCPSPAWSGNTVGPPQANAYLLG